MIQHQSISTFRHRFVLLGVLLYSLLGGCARCHHTYHYEVYRDTTLTGRVTIDYTSPERTKGQINLQKGANYFHFYNYNLDGNRQSTEIQGNPDVVKIHKIFLDDNLMYDSETFGGRARPKMWNIISDYSGDVIHRITLGYLTHQFVLKNSSSNNLLLTYSTPTFRDSVVLVASGSTKILYTAQYRDSIFGAAVQPLQGADRTSHIRHLKVSLENGATIVDRMPTTAEWEPYIIDNHPLELTTPLRTQRYAFVVY